MHRDVSFDHTWLTGVVEDFQAFLLRSYDAVLFAEADEYVGPGSSGYTGLADYMARLDGLAACCSGYNVVHYPDQEPPLALTSPSCDSAGTGIRRRSGARRLLSRIPLSWNIGFHQEFNAPDVAPDPELFLVHLHRVDYEYCLERHRGVTERSGTRAIAGSTSDGTTASLSPRFREWFFHGEDLEGTEPEPIPDRLKEAL